ncbi:MAG: AmmeMemoRadiSam system radical SAM enzyme [candidate division WOR-3 bacterium]
MNKREAEYYEVLENSKVKCKLCPHECIILPGKEGLCWARKNENGILYAQNYGLTTSIAVDPIEKKPLFHFRPGTGILSLSPNGCNMRCPYCQNYTISAQRTSTREITPQELIALAREYHVSSIAFTYSEPIIWFEFIKDTAEYAQKEGIDLVMVTNGQILEEPLNDLLKIIKAMNIDLKSMSSEYYKGVLKGSLSTVKKTIERSSELIHIEVTNLLVPGDNDEETEELAEYLSSIKKTIPLHISRYFPNYLYKKPPTPLSTLKKAYEIAKKYLYYVYIGNAQIKGTEDTYCPKCSGTLVKRVGYYTEIVGITEGKCSNCGRKVDFIL